MKLFTFSSLRRAAWLSLLIVGLLLAPHGSTMAQTTNPNVFNVNSTNDAIDIDPGDGICDANAGSGVTCTLRAAIVEANTIAGRQTIIVPAGVYRLTRTGVNENSGLRGDLDILQDVTIRGADSNNPPIIDGDDSDRVFHITGSSLIRFRMSDVVVQNGNATEATGNPFTSRFGGGIFVDGPHDVFLSRNVITRNIAGSSGGIHVSSRGLSGGRLTISSSRIERNQSGGGGGGLFTSVPTSIRNTSINRNRADGSAGGILIFSDRNGTLFTIQSSEIVNNVGGFTGGVEFTAFGTAIESQLTNVTISGNTATGTGRSATGGVSVQLDAGLTMQNVTIARNSGSAGGVFSTGTLGAENTIIAGNTGIECDTNKAIIGSSNVIGDDTCRFFSFGGGANQINTDPRLGLLALNGATNGTRTHALLTGSPAQESGSNTNCPSRDQRGISRPSGARCDIGAFEKELRVGLGTASLTPAALTTTTDQTSTLTLSWTVPVTMTWTDLRTIDLQLESGETQLAVIRFSQGVTVTEEFTDTEDFSVSQAITPTDTLTLYDETGEVGSGAIGASAVLESETVALDLAQSRLQTDGPEGKTVSLELAVRFKQPLSGKTYTATLVATNDAGELQGPDTAGTLTVGPFATFAPLVIR
jgi:hypothetical protein